MPDSLNKNDLIERIARRLKCSSCGRRYRPEDFSILEEEGNFAVMRLICRECRRQSVVFALVEHRKIRSTFSELDPDEWQRYSQMTAVERDEVIDMHRHMKVYDGDFGDVLEEPLAPDVSEE